MDRLLSLIVLLAFAKAMLMSSLYARTRQRIAYALLCPLFVCLCHKSALATNSQTVLGLFNNVESANNLILVVTLDLIASIGFFTAQLRQMSGKALSPAARLMRNMPCLILFPALYYLQLQLFNSGMGIDFSILSAILAVGAGAAIYAGSSLFIRLLPCHEARMELGLLVSLFLFFSTLSTHVLLYNTL